MRILSGAAVIAALTGCTADGFHFEHRSTLQTDATSMALYADGRVGVGSMNHQTCTFDTVAAGIIADYDATDADETIEDARGGLAIALAPDGLHLLEQTGFSANSNILQTGVIAARMTDEGVVMLVDDGGCRVEWRVDEATPGATTALPDAACALDAGFSVDPADGRAWVATGQVWDITPAGVIEVDVLANLVEFDDAAGVTYLARRGERDVFAMEDGAIAWETRVSSPVHHLAEMGALGAVAVVSGDANSARLNAFDGSTGAQIASYRLPALAEITVSPDAGTVGVMHTGAIDFFDVLSGPDKVELNAYDPPPAMYLD